MYHPLECIYIAYAIFIIQHDNIILNIYVIFIHKSMHIIHARAQYSFECLVCQIFHIYFSLLLLVCTLFCSVFWYSHTIIKHACQVYLLYCLCIAKDYYYIKIRLKFEIKYWNVDMYVCYNLHNKLTYPTVCLSTKQKHVSFSHSPPPYVDPCMGINPN